MLINFLKIFVYFSFSFFLAVFIVGIAIILITRTGDLEKLSAYECGFQPFDDSRATFDVKFYLVAIIFIIFDLEIVFLFPWCMVFEKLYFFGYLIMMMFLYILLVGFIYEWKKKALEWA